MDFSAIQAWFNANWLPIVLVIVAAYLVRRFGTMVVTQLVRRTLRYHAHGDNGEEDIKKRQDTLIIMFSTVLRVMVWLVALFTILGRFGIDLAPLLAGASVLGVALGFGAQSLIKDFISGLFIILENQYRVGDVVDLDGASGKVESITIRCTVIRDDAGSVHYIPNGVIQHTVNKTMGFARINLNISVAADTNVDKLADTVNEVGAKMIEEEKWKDKIIDAPKFVSISNFTNTLLEVKITAKTQPSAQWNVTGELRKRLLSALTKKGISLAPTAPAPPPPAAKKK